MTASPRRFSMESSNRRLSNDRQRPFQGNVTYAQSIRPQQHTSSTLGEDEYPREPIPSPYEETQGFSSNEYATPQYSKEDEMQDGSFYHGYGGAGTYVGQGSPLMRGGDHSAAGNVQNAVYVGGKTAINPQSNVDTTSHNITRQLGGLMTSSNIFKQLAYIISIGFLLWIPGLIALIVYKASASNNYNRPTVLMVGLFWWSIWLSSVWLGIWICDLIATFLPVVIRKSLGVVAVAFKTPLDFAVATKRYIALFLWCVLVYVTFLSTVWMQFPGHDSVDSSLLDPLSASNSTSNSTSSSSSSSSSILTSLLTGSDPSTTTYSPVILESNAAWMVSFSRFFFGLVICSAILLAEKVSIQSIALSFHQVTYSDRIKTSNFHITVLTNLLSHAPQKSIGPDTTLAAEQFQSNSQSKNKAQAHSELSSIFARAQKFKNKKSIGGIVRITDLTFGDQSMPFSLRSVVESSLESTNQTLKLAKRLFYAFAKSKNAKTGQEVFKEADIINFYGSREAAYSAFAIFDRDSNESITLEEMESALSDMHRERMCLLASLHDIDSAVHKLDNIFMSLYVAISCVIIAALLSTKFSTLVASLGTILLGLSWLIGSTAQESLASIVWVFCKHPIDVGDAIEVPGLLLSTDGTKDATFFVEEIQLLSTVLKTTTGKYVQVSNFQLAQKPLVNVRRSGPIKERFTVSVNYEINFSQIEKLRIKMITWINSQGKDYFPGLDIEIDSLSDQSKMDLTLDIRYKSNWQDDHLRARRRNRWLVALKEFMSEVKIYGPGGAPKVTLPDKVKETAYTLMDKHDDLDDRRFEGGSRSSNGVMEHRSVVFEQLERSKINDAMVAAPFRHGSPTTHVTEFNVRGRRGGDEHVGDIELGSRNS